MNIPFKQADSANYIAGRTKPIQYIVIHYTGNNGDSANNNAVLFAREARGVSAHCFVDEKEVWQSVKDTDTAWHCGAATYKHKYCRNENSIGVELCSRNIQKDSKGTFFFKDETVINAANLVKELMKKYNILAENIIRHYDVTGKVCPAPFVNDTKQWESFKQMLIEAKKEAVELVDKTIIMLNGNEKEVGRILKDSYNFIKLRDLQDEKIIVGYEEKKKMPTVMTK